MYLSFVPQRRCYGSSLIPAYRRSALDRIDPEEEFDTLFTPLQILSALTEATAPAAKRRRSETKDSSNFEVNLNVEGYKPDELDVKLVDKSLVISGKHEHENEHGFVSRNFTQRFTVPEDVLLDQLSCNFNSKENKMTISAPKKQAPEIKANERVIPITMTDGGEQKLETKTPQAAEKVHEKSAMEEKVASIESVIGA